MPGRTLTFVFFAIKEVVIALPELVTTLATGTIGFGPSKARGPLEFESTGLVGSV